MTTVGSETLSIGLVGCASQKLRRPHRHGSCTSPSCSRRHPRTPSVTLIVLAGEQYRYALHGTQWQHEVPMKGLGIGQQLGWLAEQLAGDARQAR
ncbi:DUF6884 domain-containing protein [Arthrobacter sp.]|uniref:DUF6884 domain-containing protein n=1 Tax=Arthrobacter sp. TaxID=1667 RepID=UPI0028121D29|nr:DUF6884 domain-containing protein [Arthrobacter sp.]